MVERGVDISVAWEVNRLSGSPAQCKQTVLNDSSRAQTKNILCWRQREQNVRYTTGLSAVYLRDHVRSSLLAVDQCTDAYLSL